MSATILCRIFWTSPWSVKLLLKFVANLEEFPSTSQFELNCCKYAKWNGSLTFCCNNWTAKTPFPVVLNPQKQIWLFRFKSWVISIGRLAILYFKWQTELFVLNTISVFWSYRTFYNLQSTFNKFKSRIDYCSLHEQIQRDGNFSVFNLTGSLIQNAKTSIM